MPYKIIKQGGGSRPYKIINKNTGKVVGSSRSEKMARASVRARYANE